MATKTRMIELVDMHNAEIENKIEEIKKYKNIIAQAKEIIEKLEEAVKDDMSKHGVTSALYGEHKVTITEVSQTKFDKKLIEELAPDLYAQATSMTKYTKFTIK